MIITYDKQNFISNIKVNYLTLEEKTIKKSINKSINALLNLNIFEKDTFYYSNKNIDIKNDNVSHSSITNSCDILKQRNISEDDFKYYLIINKSGMLSQPLISEGLLHSVQNCLKPIYYTDEFLIVIKIEENIYNIEHKKIFSISDLNIDKDNCSFLFDFCVNNKHYSVAEMILSHFKSYLVFDDSLILSVFDSNNYFIINSYFSLTNYKNIIIFLFENDLLEIYYDYLKKSDLYILNKIEIQKFIIDNKYNLFPELIEEVETEINLQNF